MDRLEQARRIFRELESQNVGHAAEVARRAFFIGANLSTCKK
jgi:hypothetical protein